MLVEITDFAIMLNGKPLTTMRKKVLQRHQVAAFKNSLFAIEAELLKRVKFIEQWNDVYKFPASITRNNLRTYKRQLKAIDKLKNFKP